MTPSPSGSPMKRAAGVSTPAKHSQSPRVNPPTGGTDTPLISALAKDADTPMTDSTPSGTPGPEVSGFTAVNSGPSHFTPLKPNGIKREVENGLTPPRRDSAKNTPDIKDRGSALKRQLSREASDDSASVKQGEGSECGERRSKRLKKGESPLHIHYISIICITDFTT